MPIKTMPTEEIIESLREMEAYFDDRADADIDGCNREMGLLMDVRRVIAALEARNGN